MLITRAYISKQADAGSLEKHAEVYNKNRLIGSVELGKSGVMFEFC